MQNLLVSILLGLHRRSAHQSGLPMTLQAWSQGGAVRNGMHCASSSVLHPSQSSCPSCQLFPDSVALPHGLHRHRMKPLQVESSKRLASGRSGPGARHQCGCQWQHHHPSLWSGLPRLSPHQSPDQSTCTRPHQSTCTRPHQSTSSRPCTRPRR